MQLPDDRAALIATLRDALARQQAPTRAGVVPFAGGVDPALPGGGLARGAVHEIIDENTGCCTAFCGYLLGRAGGPVAWIAPPRAATLPWPPGLAPLGLDPADLLLIDAGGDDALWAAEQALRCPALSAVAATLPRLDLAAARRLQLAAEAGGTLGLLLRPDSGRPSPTAARTRWRVTPLPGRDGAPHRLGAPRWRLDLLAVRGGVPRRWGVTFDTASKALTVDDLTEALAHG